MKTEDRKQRLEVRRQKIEIRWRHVWFITLSLLFAVYGLQPAFANNLAVENVSLADKDTANGTYDIQFDIAWANSWLINVTPSAAANWDAAWVFAKFSKSTDNGATWSAWKHCTLLNTGYSAPSGSQMSFGLAESDSKYKGVFIYRSSAGYGAVDWNDAEIRWAYGTDSVDDTNLVKVKVFAIEMALIPGYNAGQGWSGFNFYVGDGTSSTIRGQFEAATSGSVFQITGEGQLTLGGGDAGSLGNNNASGMYTADDFNDTTSKTLPADFPKGYNAFYIMKYELSQGQYADFLNTLTSAQATDRYPGYNGTNRHTILLSGTTYTASRPDRACNYLKWADVYAYADWAALRPFTELELEKACRGGQDALANEYAWGTATIIADVGAGTLNISGAEDGTETITSDVSLGACNYGNNAFTGAGSDLGTGPLRCGIFATDSSTRTASGAGYYGVMELSGNLWERPVTVGNVAGRTFTGAHGDGDLDTTPSGWPSASTAGGSGFRGGNWYNDESYARVSDRYFAAFAYAYRNNAYGGRCARTSP